MGPWPFYLDGNVLAFGLMQFAFFTLFTVVILLVPPHATVARVTSLFALSTLTYMLQNTVSQFFMNPQWRAAAVPLFWIQFMSASEWIVASRVDSAYISANRGKSTADNTATQAIQVLALPWNLRRVGTKWQVKTIPVTSNSDHTSNSRLRFVLRRLTTTLIAYLIMDIMISGPTPDPVLVSPQKGALIKLSSLSTDDVVFRTIGTISFWLVTGLFNLVLTNGVAILCVLSGLSSPADCPPLYSSISEAYSIRKFWGTFWHQCLRQGLNGHADVIADSVLKIPRATILSRYTRLFLAFLISGLIHHSSDLAMGIPRAEAGSLVFFLVQPLGIMLEDAMQALNRRSATSRSFAKVWRIVGYLWVVVFLAWSTPSWFYPQQRLDVDPASLLPVRIIGPSISQLQHFWQ